MEKISVLMKSKLCLNCNKIKNIDKFSKDKNRKDGLTPYCKKCNTKKTKEFYRKFPWKVTYQHIKARCGNKKCKDYKDYGGRGIECRISEDELKELWFRDKAYDMEQPTIDRKNNNGHYEHGNCRYIENILNCSKNKRKPILQFDLQSNFIMKWVSASSIQGQLKFSQSAISACCLGKRKTAYGCIWKFLGGNYNG